MTNSNTYSIGYYRDDGDFAILATLNNNDGELGDSRFQKMKEVILLTVQGQHGQPLLCLSRQDAPDSITIEED